MRAIARHHRVQSSPGYDEAAAWVADRLESFGLEVEIERVPGDGRTRYLGHLMPEGWECRHATATLVDRGAGTSEMLCDYEAEKLSLVLRSAPAHGRFRIAAIPGGASPSDYDGIDVRDAVVLTAAPVHRVFDLAVRARGAAGILTDTRRLVAPVRDAFTDPDALAYTSFWWAGEDPRGWGFVVTPRVAARLRERLRGGARLELEVAIDSRSFATEIPLLSARLQGTRAGEVLVLSHLCHPQPSANDNASGAAALIETARVLGRMRASGLLPPDGRSVRLLWMPEFTGTYAWLGRDEGRAGRLAAALNLDMVGQRQEECGSTLMLEHPPCFAASFAESLLARIRDRALDWIGGYHGVASLTRTANTPYSGGSDHAALLDPAIGVPCPMLLQWPDRYYHSSFDTPDRTDPASLALAVRCAATYATVVAGAGADTCEWLRDAIERDARIRTLADPGRGAAQGIARERERVRLASALASLARLGHAVAVEERLAAFDAFAPRSGDGPGAADARVPVRRQSSPVAYMRHTSAGYDRLTPAEREALWAFDGASGSAAHLLEVGWFAADGRRDLAAIRRLVRLEAHGRGFDEPDLGAFFDWTARLGVSNWA